MRKPKVYDVYSYGKHIFTGTRQQISKETGLAISTLANIVSHGHKQYRLDPIGKLEPVYALYEREVYVATGTVQELADMVGMSAKHLNWRQFDSVKNMGIDYRYHIYKLEGEYEVVKELPETRLTVYEYKTKSKQATGTAEELSKLLGIKTLSVLNHAIITGYKYPQVKAVDMNSSETFYGTATEVSKFSGMTERRINKILRHDHHSPNWKFTYTGKYVKPGYGHKEEVVKQTKIKPQYSHKPVPMSRYAKELLDWSTRHLRRDA